MHELQRLEQLRRQAEAGLESHQLIALVGHELRTPLSAIAAASDVLNVVAPGSPDDLEARAVIARQARKLRLLVDEMIAMGRHPNPLEEL